jgi:nicotinate phosphoribosyltransferase
VAGDEYIAWLERHGRDPREKLLIASDALDVDQILGLHAYFGGTLRNGATPADFQRASDFTDESKWIPQRRIRFSGGWGTFLTNDFRDCNPLGDTGFDPLSLVCKLTDVEGRPAVKLSDNYEKTLGPASEVERYRRIFGTEGVTDAPVVA